ncbi:MAG: VCBS repeat-containing protein [Gemmataceae bacterium]
MSIQNPGPTGSPCPGPTGSPYPGATGRGGARTLDALPYSPGLGAVAALLLPPRRPSAPAADEPPGLFRDVAAEAGLAAYRNGEDAGRYAILQTLGGGVGVIDYDRDGRPDLFFTGGGRFEGRQAVGVAPRLYRNLGGGRFQDVTAEVGLDRLAGGAPWFYSHGVAVADDDRDGWPDLLVTGYGRVALFRNEGGKRFRDATQQAGLAVPFPWATSAAWGDLDGDGWPDLYVCQYLDWSNDNDPECIGFDARRRDICPPSKFTALPHRLYRNARGVYADVGDAAGLPARPEAALQGPTTHLDAAARDRLAKAARGALRQGGWAWCSSMDGDGRPDVYVANDTDDSFATSTAPGPAGDPAGGGGAGQRGGPRRSGRFNGGMGVAVADLGGGLPSRGDQLRGRGPRSLYLSEAGPPAVHFERQHGPGPGGWGTTTSAGASPSSTSTATGKRTW